MFTLSPADLQLSWLEVFVAIQETGSFTAAARRTYRAQSRVSEQIALLERKLGAQLLTRGTRPVALTEAGRDFLPFALAALREIHAGIAAVASEGEALRGRVSVASYPGASAFVLPTFIKSFHDRHPQARVALRDLLGSDTDSADIAVQAVRGALRDKTISARLLYREPIVCVIPTDHPLGRRAAIRPSDLHGQVIVMTGTFTSERGRYHSLFTAEHVVPAEETVVGQPTTVAALAAAGLGIGVLPALAAQLVNTECRTRTVTVDAPEWSQDVYLLTDRTRSYPPVVTTFMDELVAAPLPAGLRAPSEE